MPGGLRNQPKIMRGAFVEYGLITPPLVVGFQFNPLQLSRNRTLNFSMPAEAETMGNITLRDFHQRQEFADLSALRDAQQVSINPETLSFDIRLDATDKLNEGDTRDRVLRHRPATGNPGTHGRAQERRCYRPGVGYITARRVQFHGHQEPPHGPLRLGA